MAVWILLGVVLWLAVSVVVALVLGAMIARRDRQVPATDVVPPAGAVPLPRAAVGGLTGGAGRSAPAPRH